VTKKIELLIIFSSQNTFLFVVKLSDYHSRMKRAASPSSAIINFDAINRRQYFFHARCNRHEKLASESGVEFMAPVSGACVRGFICHRQKINQPVTNLVTKLSVVHTTIPSAFQ